MLFNDFFSIFVLFYYYCYYYVYNYIYDLTIVILLPPTGPKVVTLEETLVIQVQTDAFFMCNPDNLLYVRLLTYNLLCFHSRRWSWRYCAGHLSAGSWASSSDSSWPTAAYMHKPVYLPWRRRRHFRGSRQHFDNFVPTSDSDMSACSCIFIYTIVINLI